MTLRYKIFVDGRATEWHELPNLGPRDDYEHTESLKFGEYGHLTVRVSLVVERVPEPAKKSWWRFWS